MWTFKKEIFKSDSTPHSVNCGGSFDADGTRGVYEINLNLGTQQGIAGVRITSVTIPDRFQLYYDNILVADTKFVGDALSPGPPVDIFGSETLLGNYELSVYSFNGVNFDSTGEVRNIEVVQSDIADNIIEPACGHNLIYFNKTTTYPTTAKLVVTGLTDSTIWNLIEFICPFDEELIVPGEYKFIYGPFIESEKENNITFFGEVISRKLYLGTSPVKFYCDLRGNDTYFDQLGFDFDNKFINDGITWWELDTDGTILSTGTI